MSIITQTARAQYTLSGSGQTLAVPFYFLAAADIEVVKTSTAGADTTLVLTTDYTVTGVGNPLGGSVTLVAGAAGEVVTIARAIAYTQDTELAYLSQLPAATLERAYDRLAMQVQRLSLAVKRALRIPVSNAEVAEMSLNARKGKTLQFNGTTGELELTDSADSAAAQAQASATAAAASEAAAETAQAAAEDARDVALGAVAALVVDVVNYGVTPVASAAANRVGIQAAFDAVLAAGGGEVQFNVPGVYLVNATVFIPANCTLKMVPGAVLKKSIAYGNVIMNKGALTRTFDENIHLINVQLDVSAGGVPSETIYGLMGEIALYYVKGWSIEDVFCDTVHASQFFIQTCRAEDGVIAFPRITGHKDTLHFSGGTKRVRVIGDRLSGYDDRRALNAGDYVECTPELGDIEDIEFVGGSDLTYSGGAYGYASRILTASWGNYSNGISTVRRGTTVVNGSFIYRCTNDVGAGPFTTANAPVHTTLKQEVTGADGIKWMCYQAAGITSASVRRVTFRKCYFQNPGSGSIIYANWISDTFDQSVTPGNESLSEIYHITVDDCTFASGIGGAGFNSNANIKSLRFVNCTGLDNLTTVFSNANPSGNVSLTAPSTTTRIAMTGNVFTSAMSDFFDLRRSNTTVVLYATGNPSPDSAFTCYQTGATTFKLPICDIYISLGASVGGGSVTADQGSLVRTLNALGGWVIANSAGAWKNLARELDTNTFKAISLAVADANDELLQFWGGSSSSFGWAWKLNGASTGDLQLFRRVSGADTEVVRFARSTGRATFAEYVVLDGSSGKTIRYANGTANGTVATTLGSVGPTGANAGNPLGWLRVNINGADRFVPYW